jgi:hypothetical protein
MTNSTSARARRLIAVIAAAVCFGSIGTAAAAHSVVSHSLAAGASVTFSNTASPDGDPSPWG